MSHFFISLSLSKQRPIKSKKMKNETQYSNTARTFRTESLYLAAALVTNGHCLERLEGVPPHRAVFVFIRDTTLDQSIDGFQTDQLHLPARKLLYAQKELKDRLYEQGRHL